MKHNISVAVILICMFIMRCIAWFFAYNELLVPVASEFTDLGLKYIPFHYIVMVVLAFGIMRLPLNVHNERTVSGVASIAFRSIIVMLILMMLAFVMKIFLIY